MGKYLDVMKAIKSFLNDLGIQTVGESWKELEGNVKIDMIVYKSGAESELASTDSRERDFACDICDEIESYLDSINMTIRNEDSDEDAGDARLYGAAYYEIEDRITEILGEKKCQV